MSEAERALQALLARGETLGIAESLTGGLLCDAFVQVPGSSRVFMGGIVAYDAGRKVALLGVRPETLRDKTAVSAETALEMAQGARGRLGVDHALSTTGYAGPDGERVGLVYIAYAGKGGQRGICCQLTGTRGDIRRQAVQAAVALLNQSI